ncbi:MAG: dihydropteroate synthase [Pyrinomonadaceae bacterium]
MESWQTSRRKISLNRPLVMGILNVTPDSFSDGGQFNSLENAVDHAKAMIAEGVDIIDIGGESTRPGSKRISAEQEIDRIAPVVGAIAKKFDIPISVDTSKSEVAEAAIAAGAEIVNDISGLRFDGRIAEVAAQNKTGLVLMHSRGEFETMHSQEPVEDIMADVTSDFRRSTSTAKAAGITDEQIVLDVGIGFGKTIEQNLELIANLDRLIDEFPEHPMLVGASRKSFIGKLLETREASDRLYGTLAAAAIAAWNGATILRVHDVQQTVQLLTMTAKMREIRNRSA